MKTILVFIALIALFVSQAHAIGSVSNAKVVRIRVDRDGRAMIYFDKTLNGTPPTCVRDVYKSALAIDASTEEG